MTDRKPHTAARTRTASAKKVTAKKAAKKAAKKPSKAAPARKAPAKKSSARKTSAKVTKKPATKKTAAKKTAAKKAATKKTAAKKSVNKKPAAPPVPRLSADERARLHAVLRAADPRLQPSDEADAHAGGDEQRERYVGNTWTMGTMWSDALWAACRAAAANLEQLAETPPRRTSDFTGIEVASVFFVDTTDPGTLLFAPSPEMPAALFVPVPATVEGVRTVLAEYAGDRERSVSVRAWMGFGSQLLIPNVYSGELGAVDDHELDRFFVFSPVASTLSRRTYFSASKFSYEQHGEDLFIWDLAYAPCTTSPPVIARFKAITGYNFPPDMPVDLAAAVEGFEFMTAAELEARIPGEPENTAPIVTVIAAIDWRQLSTPTRLRQYIDRDAGVQANLVNAAFRYGWERLIGDVLRAALDPELQTQIGDALAGLDFPDLPATRGARHVLPPGDELPTLLLNLATATGWAPQPLPDDQPNTRAIYTLSGSTAEPAPRILWLDIPSLELQTVILENIEELPTFSAPAPETTSADPWLTAASNAWLGQEAPLLAHLQLALTSPAWPDRLCAARLIGLARISAARDLVQTALASETHPATHKSLTAALTRIDPSAAPPSAKPKSKSKRNATDH